METIIIILSILIGLFLIILCTETAKLTLAVTYLTDALDEAIAKFDEDDVDNSNEEVQCEEVSK